MHDSQPVTCMTTAWWHCTWSCATLCCCHEYFTQCNLVTPYRDRDLGQLWLWKWFVTWRHLAISWTNVGYSSIRFCDIHLRAISQRVPRLVFCMLRFKMILLNLLPHFPGTNESKNWKWHCVRWHAVIEYINHLSSKNGDALRKKLWSCQYFCTGLLSSSFKTTFFKV